MEQKKNQTFVTSYIGIILWMTALLLGGCGSPKKPRLRVGAYFGSPTGMEFPNPDKIGNHHFAVSSQEKNGMVYTCKAGFIDIGHLREAADRTAYLSTKCYRNIILKKTTFSYRVIEPSRYQVTLTYPDDWDRLSIEEREEIAREISIQAGQYFAHTSLIWHEVLTWFGFSSLGIFPENISSFSWEDTYSDLLGTCLAMQALRDNHQSFDDAMTRLIAQTLNELDVQPSDVARKAAREVKGDWFTGGFYFLVDMKKRNFDVGFDNGQITPWLVPGICSDAKPQPCPIPDIEILSEYGFSLKLEIKPVELEKSKIYKLLDLNPREESIEPAIHFRPLLEAIKKQAVKTYGPEVQTPNLKDGPV